jgi:hypothetical protein
MKQFLLLGISILVVSACVPEAPPPPAAPASVAQPLSGPPAAAAESAAQPGGSPAGSPNNTTTTFDGTYTTGAVQNASTGKSPLECPNIHVAPPVTIRKGLAQLPVNNGRVNSMFQGYVSPDGTLAMQSEIGQTFQGQIDPNYVLRGRTVGNCVYEAAWKRTRSKTSHF